VRHWLRIPLVIKLFLALILLQGSTLLLFFLWVQGGSIDLGIALVALGGMTTFFAALWMTSLSRHHHTDQANRLRTTIVQERERHLRQVEKERERHLRQVEQERQKASDQLQRNLSKVAAKTRNRSDLRLYGALATAGGLGALLLLTQFLTLGLLLLSTTGGALAGYAYRTRQEFSRKNAADPSRIQASPLHTAPGLSSSAPRTGLRALLHASTWPSLFRSNPERSIVSTTPAHSSTRSPVHSSIHSSFHSSDHSQVHADDHSLVHPSAHSSGHTDGHTSPYSSSTRSYASRIIDLEPLPDPHHSVPSARTPSSTPPTTRPPA